MRAISGSVHVRQQFYCHMRQVEAPQRRQRIIVRGVVALQQCTAAFTANGLAQRVLRHTAANLSSHSGQQLRPQRSDITGGASHAQQARRPARVPVPATMGAVCPGCARPSCQSSAQ